MQASKTIGLVRQPLEAGSIAPGLTTATIIVAVMMSACFVALSHDDSYLGSTKEKSVERGVGLKQHAKFEKDVNAAPPQRKIAFLVLLGVAGYCLLTHRRGVSFSFGPTAIMMLSCLLLVVASLLWSIDRGETGKEIVRILAYFFIAAAIAMRLRPRELCFVLATMGVASTLIALGAEIVTGHFRPWSNGYRLNGTLHSNVLASHAMFAALISFAFLQTSKRPLLLATVVLAMLAVIFLTKTRGALATTGVGIGTIFFARKSPYAGVLAMTLLLSTMCLLTLLFAVAGSEVQERVKDTLLMGRSEGATTLTGRLPLWQELWRQSRDHHWMGFGYGAFWTVDQMEELERKLQWYPGHAHSVYMQTILDVGLIGLMMFVLLALTCLVRARKLMRITSDPAFSFSFGFLVAGFVDGLVEVSFVYPRGLGLVVAISIFSLVIVHAPETNRTTVASEDRKSNPLGRVSRGYRSQLSC